MDGKLPQSNLTRIDLVLHRRDLSAPACPDTPASAFGPARSHYPRADDAALRDRRVGTTARSHARGLATAGRRCRLCDTLGVHQTPHCAGFKAPRACADRIFDESTQGDRILAKALLEHQIHDDLDLARHVDYVHYNPVKHGLVERVADWPHSTFHRHVTRGLLPSEWAAASTGDAGFGEP